MIGQRQLGLGATGFGLLMGCLGTGAVLAGLTMSRIRATLGLEKLVAVGAVGFALAMAVSAVSHLRPLVYAALVGAGAAWMSVMSTYNTATQTSVPPWVRARATAMHTLCALGSFAIGSAFWGALSDILGLSAALLLAALTMAAGMLLARPFPLRMGELEEVTQAPLSEDLFVAHQPDPEGRDRSRWRSGIASGPSGRRASSMTSACCGRPGGATARPSGASTATSGIRHVTSSASS